MVSDQERSNGLLTRLHECTYLASHPSARTELDGLSVGFWDQGITFDRGSTRLAEVAWSDVDYVEADDRDEVSRSITLPRLAILGVLAFVVPKTTPSTFLIVEDRRGPWIFSVPDLTSVELRLGLEPIVAANLPDRHGADG